MPSLSKSVPTDLRISSVFTRIEFPPEKWRQGSIRDELVDRRNGRPSELGILRNRSSARITNSNGPTRRSSVRLSASAACSPANSASHAGSEPMPPFLALILWFVLLVALFWWDPAKESKTPLALWVPLIWMFILGSRLPAQWIGGGSRVQAQALEEGDPLDRAVFLVLILLAIVILLSRSFRWDIFFGRNLALMAFLLFALLSVTWSDFPFVALKRWFRDLGDYLVILVVLSDPC